MDLFDVCLAYHDHDGVDVGHVYSVLDDRGGQQDVSPAQRELEHDIFEAFHLPFRRVGCWVVASVNLKQKTCVIA